MKRKALIQLSPNEKTKKVKLKKASMLENVNELGSLLTSFGISKEQGSDFSISPLSIYYCLAVLREGSSGRTRQELSKVLGLLEEGLDINSNELRIETKMKIVNGFFFHPKIIPNSNFVNVIKDRFSCTIENTLDVDYINSIFAKQTNNLIKDVIKKDQVDTEDRTTMIISNVLYFDGEWYDKFHGAEDEEFNAIFNQNPKTIVKMMTQSGFQSFGTHEFDGCKCSSLSLLYRAKMTSNERRGSQRGGLCYNRKSPTTAMLFIRPNSLDVSDFLNLEKTVFGNTKSINRIINEQKNVWVQEYKIPKFSVEYELNLTDGLKALGCGTMFNRDNADFLKMIDPRIVKLLTKAENVYAKEVTQRVVVKVDEEGTVAAAVTFVALCGGGCPKSDVYFKLDRPFLFVIYDLNSKTCLFNGRIVNPVFK